MFRTTTFLAVFVALIASAQAALPTVTCADYKKDNGCATVGTMFGTSAACTGTANAAGAAGTCYWNSGDSTCTAASSNNDLNHADWLTTEQQACDGKTTAADCGTTSCTWIATSAATNECTQNPDSVIATLVAASGTTAQIAFTKSRFIDTTCKPLYKDAATCNANAKCYYNTVTKKCTGSVAYWVANLADAGCTTEAEAVATSYDTTVAASQAAVASGAAGFSSGAVILSALVAALALVA